MTENLPQSIFRGLSFCPATKEVAEFSPERTAAVMADRSVFAWIDLQSADESALRNLLSELSLDHAAAEHFRAQEILPRIEEAPRYVSFHLYEVEDPDRHLNTSNGLSEITAARLVVVLGSEFIVTFHAQNIAAVEAVRRTSREDFKLAGRTAGFVAFLLLQRSLYDFADVNLASDNYLDDLEPTVGGAERGELARSVATASRNILVLKKLTTNLHIVLMLLATKRSQFVTEEARVFYREMQENALAVRSAVDSSRDMLDGVVGAMQAESARRTTDIATVLTIVSAIMLPLTLIAGMYGMNFESIPGAAHPNGFWWLTVGMIVIAGGMVWVFHRLGWVRRN